MTDFLRFLSWYLAISVLGWVSLPIIFRLLPNLASKGFALARPLGLLVWGYLFWLLCSLGILQNNTGGVVLAFGLLIALSVWSCVKGRGRDLIAWIKANVKTIVVMEVLFFVAFAAWTIVRAANPEAVNTEKPMELAFINGILKSPSFPPMDPWLSGFAISYYYFGYVIVSMLIRVTGVASSIGFNLSSALWFGLTALASYGILFDLLATWKSSDVSKQKLQLVTARLGAFFAPLFVLFISCFEGVLEFLYSNQIFWKADASGVLTSKFWTWLAISELDTGPTMPVSFWPNRPAGWMWWRGSRVLQDLTLTGGRNEVIDEFPFFTYLLSDLHPHLLAMPFCLLAIGLCLNLFLSAKSYFVANESIFKWFKRWDFWFIALILGSLAFINTWDFPIYVGLFCLVVTVMRIRESGWSGERIWDFIKSGLMVGITGVVLFLPFYLGFSSQAGGLLPSMEFMTRGIHFWVFFGALLIPIFIWLVFQLWQIKNAKAILKGLRFASLLFISLFVLSLLFGLFIFSLGETGARMLSSSNQFIVVLGQKAQSAYDAFVNNVHFTSDSRAVVLAALTRRLNSPGTWITLLLMLTGTWALLGHHEKDKSSASVVPAELDEPKGLNTTAIRPFVTILILIGIALTVFPEFFYLRDQFGNRMNTIFKFYFQAWILWGIAGAYASVELLSRLKRLKAALFTLVLTLTVIGGLAYPMVMLGNKTNNFKPTTFTLDGNDYLARSSPDDYAAIQWLSQQPLGVVSEAIGGQYSDFARVSTRSGMPTVMGWPAHESQWRGGAAEFGSRQEDIPTLYTSNDWTLVSSIIKRYNIRYIYFGPLEVSTYKADGALFKANLPLVYQNNGVSIFEVPGSNGEVAP
jgi:YYY domain-containing protein